ncbi:MAG TPA: hypothetical protein VKM94_21355 [Blastocatellia bacterium]|nr:hypothetical protein [Blastocatellia bacterium]
MQYHQKRDHRVPADLKTPIRNRYFFGKLLDVMHLEMEQEYFNSKRALLNRLVTGPGVVCGLDVELSSDNNSVIVLPGVAIDRCGREIIVTRPSQPVELPPQPPHPSQGADYQPRYQGKYEHPEYYEEDYAHVVLCYHECESDPVRAVAGDCESVAFCVAGSVREQYEVIVRDGFAPERKTNFPDVIDGRRISYAAIVDYVTRGCRALPDDCCVPLANIRLRYADKGWEPEVDITVRPIVYNNRLLFDLIQSLVNREESEY